MKKFLAVLLAAGLSIPAYAEQVVTPNASGDNPFLDYSGVSTARLTSTQGTTGTLISSNPVIVYGLQISSVAATTYVKMYSTNSVVLNGATPKLLQWNDDNATDEGAGTGAYKFVAPVKFSSGLVAQMSTSVEAGPQSEVVIFYRESK
jgi:hypothetical protein